MADSDQKKDLSHLIVSLLQKESIIAKGGISIVEIEDKLQRYGFTKPEIRDGVHYLYWRDVLVAIFDKKGGNWHTTYYYPRRHNKPLILRLERILTELGVPNWMDVRLSRAGGTILIGKYNETPFSIIDYSLDPPVIFRDRRAGGRPNEIVYSQKRYTYTCRKDGREIKYDHHGNRR